jgi:hypothetical protein
MPANYGEAIKIVGLKELEAKAKAASKKLDPELRAGNYAAALEVKTKAQQIASGIDKHAATAADAIYVSASAASAKLVLQRTPAVPFALGAEWGAKHNLSRTVFKKVTKVHGPATQYQRRQKDGTYKTFTRKGKAVATVKEGARTIRGWNQFKDWRGNATSVSTGDELGVLGAGRARTADDLPAGYFMYPAFREMIPAIREQEQARVQELLAKEFARLNG